MGALFVDTLFLLPPAHTIPAITVAMHEETYCAQQDIKQSLWRLTVVILKFLIKKRSTLTVVSSA